MLFSLRWRLLLSFGLVIIVAVGATAFFISQAARLEIQRIERRAEAARAERLTQILEQQSAQRQGWQGYQPVVEQVGDLFGQRVLITDSKGAVVADSLGLLFGLHLAEVQTAKKVPVVGPQGQLGTLLINPQPLPGPQPDIPALMPQPSINWYLVWGGLTSAMVALLLTFFFSWRFLAPLEALSHAAARVARRDFSARVNAKSGGEVGQLARTFNTMTQELQSVENLRRNMVADISHELRTPITNIRGYLEALQDGVVKPEAATFASVHEEVLLLSRLVEDLQELALAEAGQLALDFRPCDLNEVTRAAVTGIQPRAEASGLALTMQSDGPIPLVADPERLGQVVRNLLTNAVKYTPQGGQIKVTVSTNGSHAQVQVEDTGIGIPQEDLPHLFERFYRVDKSRSRTTGGSGLGLTIARRLVEAHGGRIWATSQHGKGSVFTFIVPKGAVELEAS